MNRNVISDLRCSEEVILYHFAHCDLGDHTLRSCGPKFPANCVIKEINGDRVNVWVDGLVKITLGPSGKFRFGKAVAGVSITADEMGRAVWADPMGDHPKAVLLESGQEAGQVVWVRLV